MTRRVLAFGVAFLFRGLRQGRPWLASLGAALTVISWLRNRPGDDGEPIYRATLRDGRSVRIRYLEGDDVVDEVEVAG
jgi:hypothetical protein